jgi:hypothetical protein
MGNNLALVKNPLLNIALISSAHTFRPPRYNLNIFASYLTMNFVENMQTILHSAHLHIIDWKTRIAILPFEL